MPKRYMDTARSFLTHSLSIWSKKCGIFTILGNIFLQNYSTPCFTKILNCSVSCLVQHVHLWNLFVFLNYDQLTNYENMLLWIWLSQINLNFTVARWLRTFLLFQILFVFICVKHSTSSNVKHNIDYIQIVFILYSDALFSYYIYV